jgi:hypothetical protein
MKKIFTLFVAVGLITAVASAQQSPRTNRDNSQYSQRIPPQTDQRDWNNSDRYDNDDRYDKNNGWYGRGLEMQIAKINRKYDLQVMRVKNSHSIRRFEKTRMIRSLENQRQQEIRMLYARSGNNKNGQRDRRYDSNQY